MTAYLLMLYRAGGASSDWKRCVSGSGYRRNHKEYYKVWGDGTPQGRTGQDHQGAFYIARSGKPGPVLVDLPKDVMGELGSSEYPKEVNIRAISQIQTFISDSLRERSSF